MTELSLQKMFASPRWGHVAPTALIFVGLSLILWSAMVVWQHPCPVDLSPQSVNLSCPSPLEYMIPLTIALGFWAISLLLFLTGQQTPLLAFFVLIGDALAVGMSAGTGAVDDAGGRIFHLVLAWIVPLTLHAHLALLARPPSRVRRVTLGAAYVLATLLSIPFLLFTITTLQEWNLYGVLRAAVRLGIVLAFALAWFLLFRDYRHYASPAVRSQIRLIIFGTLLAFAPFIWLSLLPETLLGSGDHVPYEFTFPFLLLSPLGYAYSVFRHRLVWSEVILNRAAVYYVLLTLLTSAYLMSAAWLGNLYPSRIDHPGFINALVSLSLLLCFMPLRRRIEQLMNWVLYGGEIRYETVIQRLTASLSLTLERDMLRRLLVDDLASAMHLSKSALFLRDQDGKLAFIGRVGFASEMPELHALPCESRLVKYLEVKNRPLADHVVRQAFAARDLCEQALRPLLMNDLAFWIPLVSGGSLQGLLLVGPKVGGELFTGEDERILSTLALESGIAAHNVRLMEQAKASRQDLARAHQQLLISREKELQNLSHDLHDGVVQQLLGISYQIAERRKQGNTGDRGGLQPLGELQDLEMIRSGILGVVTQLRELIRGLRPPGLEEMGLAAALESYVTRLKREGGCGTAEVELTIDQSNQVLSAPLAITLFRAAQEAIRNAVKHAQASRICVDLTFDDQVVDLRIRDDGCGFCVPLRLSELARADHFGLIGVAERVAWVGGHLKIDSEPGKGTQVVVRIPLNQEDRDDRRNHSSALGG